MEITHPEDHVLVVSEFGYGKRTRVEEYPLHGRGGQGVRTFKTNPKTGELIAARVVDPAHELMLISEGGIVLRTPVEHISLQLRSTQGVTIHDVEGDRVAAVAVIDMDREYESPDALPTGATAAGEQLTLEPERKASARDATKEAFGKSAAGPKPSAKASAKPAADAKASPKVAKPKPAARDQTQRGKGK